MSQKKVLFWILSILFLISTSTLHSQIDYVETAPWECDDISPIYTKLDSTSKFEKKPAIILANFLINSYQHKLSNHSVSRCPFYISCSNYAHLAVKRYGFLIGVCFFLDRNMYRENIMSYYHYRLKENNTGVLKLDDSFYLLGKEYQ